MYELAPHVMSLSSHEHVGHYVHSVEFKMQGGSEVDIRINEHIKQELFNRFLFLLDTILILS